MRKICVVITSRSTYGRLKSVCKAIQEHLDLELQLIIGASLYDLPVDFTPDERIQCLIDSDNHRAMVATSSLLSIQLAGIFERLKPDIVLVHGDRYEVLDVAKTAAYMNIPLAHTEGGEITGSIDNKVRNAITQLADIHFPVTWQAKDRLLMMGVNPDITFVVGSAALDAIKNIDLSNNRTKPYIVILWHPNTTEDEPIYPLINALQSFNIHKIWVNPNVDAGNKAILKEIHKQDVEFVKNLPPEEYARLIKNCECLVGNTSSGIKEGAFLGVPYVCIGNRQKGRDAGPNVLRVPNEIELIKQGISAMTGKKFSPSFLFGDGTAGKRIANILAEVSI